jgi:hypothetical protein
VKVSEIVLQDGERVEWIGGYPQDFHEMVAAVLLSHGIEDAYEREVVVVSQGDIRDHYDEWNSAVQAWTGYDWTKVGDYEKAYAEGANFPPLIAQSRGDMLLDGYHRLAMYANSGDTEVDFIYLERQPRERIDGEYELSGGDGMSAVRVC